MFRLKILLAGILLAGAQMCGAASLIVPANASLAVGSGSIIANGDIGIGGNLDLGSGRLLSVQHFQVDGSGTANLGSGSIELSGDWSNSGNVVAGNSLVRMIDGGAANASIDGSTTFADFSIVTSIGKRYLLQVGMTQTVAGLLNLHGTASAPLQLASSTSGVVANLNLLPSGTQSISTIGVSDVHATGQHLAPDQTNQGGTGNDNGWFGDPVGVAAVPLPSLSTLGQLLLILTIIAAALLPRRRNFRN